MLAAWLVGFVVGIFRLVGHRVRFGEDIAIGGLVGSLDERGNVSFSWSSSAVLGRGVAGLVGEIIRGNVSSSWSSGSIDVDQARELY